MNDPDKLIEKLKMVSHPEGGYFSESFRGENNNVSLIYYLLKKNEILHFYDGDPLNVYISKDGQSTDTKILGKNIDKKELMHLVVNSGFWFSMKSSGVYSFIGCTVAPGFNYTDFELAPPDWEPKKIKI